MNDTDPITSNPDFYRLLWENDEVRVLEYIDQPGQETTPHRHPDSVLVALTDFTRQLSLGEIHRDVSLSAGSVQWLPAQTHSGKNTGTTATHTILIELKHSGGSGQPAELGPADRSGDPRDVRP